MEMEKEQFTAGTRMTPRQHRAFSSGFLCTFSAPALKETWQYVLGTVWACLLFTSTAYTQNNKPIESAKGVIKIPVWVETENNQLWQDGKRQSFKVFLDDQEAPIKSFQGPRNSTILLIVTDTVADLARVAQAQIALAAAINGLPENYWLGLLRAQDGLAVLQEPTANRATMLEKLQALQVSGKAGLLDSLEPLAQLATTMQQKAGVRLCVLYVTDSGVANYRADLLNPVINSSDSGDLSRRFADRAVQERMSAYALSLSTYTIPFFILHLEYRGDTLNLAYQSGLEQITSNSGGAALFCRTNDEIAPALSSLLDRIRAEYVIGIEVSASKRPSAKLRIEAVDAGGQAFLQVQHPSQITLRKR
jgi:hypothetical protein